MKKILASIASVVLLGTIAFASSCGPVQISTESYSLHDFIDMFIGEKQFEGDGILRTYYLDVGQGDSEFIEFPDGRTMLIDASEAEYADDIEDFIEDRGVSKIDYIVITHPHSDHYGGMNDIIQYFDIGEIYMPDATNNAKGFERLLLTIDQKNIPIVQTKAGLRIEGLDGLSIDFLAPNSSQYSEINNYSAVLKITYGNTSFLYMGDAEKLSENEIKADVKCDVIKVGHHGSKTSSGEDFVNKTSPEYAVISVGEDNQYGLPDQEIIERWEISGANVLRTDIDGTIAFESNGNDIKRIEP
ncbi:MAG: ComEC/Rec2 family competence protein [Monoglobales bacterium]